MLSFVITLFSIASEPSELAMASWLNSTVCFCTALNLEINRVRQEKEEFKTQFTDKKEKTFFFSFKKVHYDMLQIDVIHEIYKAKQII